ncbi:beta-1,3-galactosyltransferase 1-like [Lytechinus pictus]|uniref:beta-1,3-galactosyltransferase 1-like n=1 Tax=Lytechinus pictus TaxID=7653 RepID=UPI0030B9F5C9
MWRQLTIKKAVQLCCVLALIFPLVAYFTALSRSPEKHQSRKVGEILRYDGPDGKETARSNVKPPARGWMEKYNWTPIAHGVYDFLINPVEKCKVGNGNFTLLILIKSAASHASHRAIIRETYVRCIEMNNISARMFFILGTTTNDTYREGIRREADLHGDILQADFADNYYNLTIKLIMAFKWAATFCNNNEFLMSADDDVVMDISTLVQDLRALPLEYRSNLCLGDPIIASKPIRNVRSKYYVPKEMYPEDTYPTYPSGPGYVLSQDVVRGLYDASKGLLPRTPTDDVYSGFLLKARGIHMVDMITLFPLLHPERRGFINDKDYLYFMAQLSLKEMKSTWNDYSRYCISTELVHGTTSNTTLILKKNQINGIFVPELLKE